MSSPSSRGECTYTLYAGAHYEQHGRVTSVEGDPPLEACDAQQTSYFNVNGQAVALRSTYPYEEAPFQWVTTSTVAYLHRDRLGYLTEVTDEAGEIVGLARYDALGQVLSSTIPATVTGRLAGGQLDADAGLVYDGDGRFFDPVLGVYVQPDPFGGAPEAPESLNRYAALGVSTLPTLGSVPGENGVSEPLWTNGAKVVIDETTNGLWIVGRLGGRLGSKFAGYLQGLSTIQITKYRKTYRRVVEHARLDRWIRASYSGIENLRAKFGGFLPLGGLGQRGLKWAHGKNVSVFSELVPYPATVPNRAWYGRAAGRLGTLPWSKIGAEFAGGVAVDVVFQFGLDWFAHPDWTWQQRGLSVAAQIPGSLVATTAGLAATGAVSWAAGSFASLAFLGGVAGPVGLVVAFGVALWFDYNWTPKIEKSLGLN